jgi:osmotically-inducible protein OsmY
LDKLIAQDIEAALERNVYVDAERVTVNVENGRVTLTGTLLTSYARAQAHDAASYAPAVISVQNRIAIT